MKNFIKRFTVIFIQFPIFVVCITLWFIPSMIIGGLISILGYLIIGNPDKWERFFLNYVTYPCVIMQTGND